MGSDSVSGEFFGPVVRKNQFCGSLFKYGPKPIQANEILSSFDVGLRQYATNHLTKSGVSLMRGVVKEVHAKKIVLNNGTDVPYGLLVWSTGVGPSKFVKSLDLPKSPGGRIGVDGWMRVPSVEDVFALGDCAGFLEETVPSVEDVFALGDYVIRTC